MQPKPVSLHPHLHRDAEEALDVNWEVLWHLNLCDVQTLLEYGAFYLPHCARNYDLFDRAVSEELAPAVGVVRITSE